jgi:lipoprotein-releasing system ATP-binding protein
MSAASQGRALALRGVTRSFHKAGVTVDVLRGVDLDLAPGEAVALLGRSGSGKSTLLHILGGLEPPTSGEVLVDGAPLYARREADLDAYRRGQVGFVFQFHHLLPDHDALANVAMPLRIAGAEPREARARAEALLHEVGLGARLRHAPGELSGGEQQRVAIARALVARPGLVLADEPTGNLDPATASGVLDLLLAHTRALGATLVTVTHSLELAERFPRRLRLREGRIEDVA